MSLAPIVLVEQREVWRREYNVGLRNKRPYRHDDALPVKRVIREERLGRQLKRKKLGRSPLELAPSTACSRKPIRGAGRHPYMECAERDERDSRSPNGVISIAVSWLLFHIAMLFSSRKGSSGRWRRAFRKWFAVSIMRPSNAGS